LPVPSTQLPAKAAAADGYSDSQTYVFSPKRTDAQILLEIHLRELGLEFVPEFKFHPEREWRFDYLVMDPFRKHIPNCAIEIEGGVWKQGRHTRGSGYLKDMEKYREAAALGYKVYRFSPQEVLNGTALEFLRKHCS